MTPLPHPLAPDLRSITRRDIAWLLASLLLVVAPHAERAPWWLTALTFSLYAWRAAIAVYAMPLPSRWAILAIAAAAMLGVWAEYRTIFGRSPGIVLLVLFSGLKLLEMRTHRDAAVTVFLCYFLIITNFLYSQSIPTALLMCAALVVVTTTLVGFNAPTRSARFEVRTAGLLLAHAVPAALVLFVLFPRIQGPLWGLPQDVHAGVSGLSDTMSPGNLARLALSDSIALRAEFEGPVPEQRNRYWRGPVLWEFDGRTWHMGQPSITYFEPPEGGTRLHRYSVILEPHDRNWLFGLEAAASLPPRARFTRDGQILARNRIDRRIRYDMVSMTDAAPRDEEHPAVLSRARRLPPEFNPRTRDLAASWRRETDDDARLLGLALAYLQKGGYTYTLEPPLLGRDSVDEFLFATRAGFCEHFASAFVVLMRAAGVPARVVTGYQGGEPNPVDRILTVRQSDAHAWAEVYLRERGWVRVDPTAAAVPGRIESGIARALPVDARMPLLLRPQFDWLRKLRNNWEALVHQWNTWVLGYNPERQRELMSYMGMRDADWRKLTVALFTVLGGLTVLLLAWSLRHLVRPDPVQRAWLAFCRKVGARGLARAAHEGPRDYAVRIGQRFPEAAASVDGIVALYIALRYGAGPVARDDVTRLRRLVREVRLT